jgi:aspartyl-tRNA(Asn)/glutamyl-tRNA(Gln) amidotransferase subunit A
LPRLRLAAGAGREEPDVPAYNLEAISRATLAEDDLRSVAPTIVATDLGGTHEAEAAIQAITRFMWPTNFLGLPSLVVPAGQSKSGLPIGMQLIGRPFGDETLIALGRAFQAATNHHRRVPALP